MRNALERVTLTDLEYLDGLHARLEGAFAAVEGEGGRENIPVVGTAVGRVLHVIVRATGARRILEIGTAIGYSALWMATALPEGGELVTIDPDRERTSRARRHWDREGVGSRIRVINAPALEALPTLSGPFDVVFIDALKHEYAGYLDAALPLLRPGGTVLVDNLLWGGRASGSAPYDRTADTAAIREFNAAFTRDPRLSATILPVGDGLGIGVKRG
ncbi:O-methyltransferase [soil metagenome]